MHDFIKFRGSVVHQLQFDYDCNLIAQPFLEGIVNHHRVKLISHDFLEAHKNLSYSAGAAAEILAPHIEAFFRDQYRLHLQSRGNTKSSAVKIAKAWALDKTFVGPNLLPDFFPLRNNADHDKGMRLYKHYTKGKRLFTMEIKPKKGQKRLEEF